MLAAFMLNMLNLHYIQNLQYTVVSVDGILIAVISESGMKCVVYRGSLILGDKLACPYGLMPAQRIETNMFAFPSHPVEIFLEFHSEIEGKEIHRERILVCRAVIDCLGWPRGLEKIKDLLCKQMLHGPQRTWTNSYLKSFSSCHCFWRYF